MLVEGDGRAGACKQPVEVAARKRQQQQEQLGALTAEQEHKSAKHGALQQQQRRCAGKGPEHVDTGKTVACKLQQQGNGTQASGWTWE